MKYNELMASFSIDENYLNVALGIPKRTFRSWKNGEREAPAYVMELLAYFIFNEIKEGRL